jgi:hypothetical protein
LRNAWQEAVIIISVLKLKLGKFTHGSSGESFENKMNKAQTNLSKLVQGHKAVAERLDCGVFSAALSRRLASRRSKSGDESPQSRRFAPFVSAHEFVAARN